MRDDHPADRGRPGNEEAGLFGDRPRHHERRASRPRRRLAGGRRSRHRGLGELAQGRNPAGRQRTGLDHARIDTHTATDIANALPQQFVQINTISKDQYIAGLNTDKGQVLPDGIMPAGGSKTIYAMEKSIGPDVSKVTLANTFTNDYATQANKTEGTNMTTTPAGAAG